jgi:hypothetical protein
VEARSVVEVAIVVVVVELSTGSTTSPGRPHAATETAMTTIRVDTRNFTLA